MKDVANYGCMQLPCTECVPLMYMTDTGLIDFRLFIRRSRISMDAELTWT